MKRAVLLGVALATAGCGDEAVPAPGIAPPVVQAGTLSVDIRGAVDVRLDGPADARTIELSWKAGDTLSALGSATQVAGEARPVALDAGSTLITAKLALPADPAGICGDAPMALALSLRRSGSNRHVGGGLTVYCGDKHYGVPARIFRLAGDL